MSRIIRCRCPLCGVLVNQERLNQDYEFEFVVQEITSKGRGRICNTYRKANVAESTGFQLFKFTLAEKLHAVADRMMEKMRADAQGEVVEAEYVELEADGEMFPMVECEYDAEESGVVVSELEMESEGGDETCYEGEIEPEFVMEMDYRE